MQIKYSENYNEKRRKLLLARDENLFVSNINYAMYDLTPYFSDETFDCSLSEKILFASLESKRITHLKNPKYFMSEQIKTLKQFQKYKRLVLMAPTSFGKTLLIKEYIYKQQFKRVAIIVPTNSLAFELESSFKSPKETNFENYVIFDKVKNEIFDKNTNYLFVGTQERFLEISDEFNDIDLFVIDEAYKLKDRTSIQRNYRLSKVFLDEALEKSKQIILLSPNAEFEGFDEYNFHYESINFNGVDKVYNVVNEEKFYEILNEKAKDAKTILFCKKPSDINKLVDEFKSMGSSLKSFASFLSNEIHPDWSVVKFLNKGILVHHGQMPKFVQNKMQYLFLNNKECNLLIGTNSISEGINTPAKNLFISPSFLSTEDTMLLKNTVGRAGRLGVYPIGHIFSTREIEEECKTLAKIKLAVANEDDLSEIKESKNDIEIDSCSELYGISSFHIKYLLKNYSISLTKLKLLFNVLKKDLDFKSFKNLVKMASEIFKSEYKSYLTHSDYILITVYLLSFTYVKDSHGNYQQVNLDTFNDKMMFYSQKTNKNLTDSIDDYMFFCL